MPEDIPLYGPSTPQEAEELLQGEGFNHYMSMFMGWHDSGVTHQQKVDTLLSRDFKENMTRIITLSGVSDLMNSDEEANHPGSVPCFTSVDGDDEDKPSLPYNIEPDPVKAAHPIDLKLVFTTIPPKKAGEPDGYTSCIIRPPALSSILKAEGYPQAVPKPTSPSAYEIKATPDMGLGVFATQDINIGTIIFAERPILVSHRFGMRPSAYGEKEINVEWEKELKIAVGRMSAEYQARFTGLSNRYEAEYGDTPLVGIFKTNATLLEDVYDGQLKEDEFTYGGILPIGSRINHSCRPNTTRKFFRASFSIQYTAAREIKAGEQLFYPYCQIDQSTADRHAKLKRKGWTFACNCDACVGTSSESN